jgi:hypothetical protein
MAIVFTGSKTVTKDVGPTSTAAILTALMATAPENLTLANLKTIQSALKRLPAGTADPSTTLGTIFG